MNIRTWAQATSLCLVLGAASYPSAAQEPSPASEKVLRYAFQTSETGLDPVQLSDLYSRYITQNVFDSLYEYDYLARPVKVRPSLADGMPQVSPDYTTFTVKMRRGIYFADDAAF